MVLRPIGATLGNELDPSFRDGSLTIKIFEFKEEETIGGVPSEMSVVRLRQALQVERRDCPARRVEILKGSSNSFDKLVCSFR